MSGKEKGRDGRVLKVLMFVLMNESSGGENLIRARSLAAAVAAAQLAETVVPCCACPPAG
jgi:hypothetical protein